MQNLLSSFKKFNSNHRKLVPFIIYFEIAAIVLASILKSARKNFKVVALTAVIIVAIAFAAVHLKATGKQSDAPDKEIVETVSVEEMSAVSASSEEPLVNAAVSASSEEPLVNAVVSESSDEGLMQFIKNHPDAVGWIWFEDDLLSYPIMQAGDNDKYAIKDYDGNDSDTGALFLDYRSSADFSDPNSIIYGHNMRNRTMFGALRAYKENLEFLECHKYFQIITPEGTSRYLIFAFMDVPQHSYIYDVVGANPSNMREFLDTIEYKTYIDTGIEPTVEDKIITLSTCTKSDSLFFVMFAVQIDN
ncbi:class B sortase [Butyrivibrio sp. VCB2006]|uniref:class B sortase n=1 Tax=Butyrivibrio sp. VCB2006 TaxID=1280679 RepID=UPI00040960B3|nr:class B sortase [Butyrivibrio sp. VCB2006]